MERDLLADWASEAEHLYRWVRQAAFVLGLVITLAAATFLDWTLGWLIAGLLAVVVARSLVVPAGRIEIDIALDALVLGLISWMMSIPSGWIILAFPVAFAAIVGHPRLGIGVSFVSLFFGVAPRLVPGWAFTEVPWVPATLQIEAMAVSTMRGLA